VSELFSQALERATTRKLSAVDLLSVVDQLKAAGESELIPLLYQKWIEYNPDESLLYAIYFNYGVVLSNAKNLAGAKAALTEAIRINPDFLPPYINMGFILERLGATKDAIVQWYNVVNKLQLLNGDTLSYKTEALKQIGRVFEAAQLDANAEDVLRQSLDINPKQHEVIQHWLSLRQRQCKWPTIAPWGNITREALLEDISPLSLAIYTDDPLLQLGNAFSYCTKLNIGHSKVNFMDKHQLLRVAPKADRLRIGYLSSDLREHAIGFLTAELFELHDRERVEVFIYYCGHEVFDPIHYRIKKASDHWVDLASLSDEQAAQQIITDRIGILIDVNGYTHGARTKLLAMRPAPIIVNWLGFPGTTGSPYHNYIIADDFIIPPEHEIFYSEKVKRLPCYQPNDRKRIVAEHRVARQDMGLPENDMIYCCFNGVQKITPFTWGRWMSILEQVPASVLWLLDGGDGIQARLKELALQHGIAQERLVFASKVRNAEHLARYPLADLFLDTSPYGAHTTASDAMWMGVPILTLAGRTFASRVCGSLAKSAGLEELICTRAEDYVRLAVELGNNRTKLQEFRDRLSSGRDACVLFDTPKLVVRLEAIYAELWEDFVQDRVFRPDLSNMEIYAQIGADLDTDTAEVLSIDNYLDIYKDKLAIRDNYCFIRSDSRLWRLETVRHD
jgi:predicted O-linked N-acetylglucosamine transferase (SPINDLY family)